jgi:hypothetical protein
MRGQIRHRGLNPRSRGPLPRSSTQECGSRRSSASAGKRRRWGDRATVRMRMERALQRMYLESRSRSHHGHGGDGVAFGSCRRGSGGGGVVPRAGDGGGGGGSERGEYGCEYGGLVSLRGRCRVIREFGSFFSFLESKKLILFWVFTFTFPPFDSFFSFQ